MNVLIIKEYPKAILFLDSSLLTDSTFETLNRLLEKTSTIVIFTADILLKPIDFHRFCHKIERVFIWVKQGKKYFQIALQDIVVIRAMKDYMELILKDRGLLAHVTLQKLEDMLPHHQFIRVNRSYIVRKSAIIAIQDMHIETILKDVPRIPIGSNYWDDVKLMLQNAI